ncbi:hypothetical protein FE326_06795 [Dolosigranulum pigrum]|uniref:phage tail spike protein n=1 Tax=Dolosigranulum pigrum TaxID=29394 RepID=UPI001AD89C9E|nr:phage tail spike protein [Dolosigranulum pigrum]QTJ41890.1 hypothetical protein FE326_06795 [Dolosigranulum pigrum]
MIPVLFSKEEKQFRSYGIGPLFETLHAEVKRERNGQYNLYMTYPQNGKQASVFKEGMRIKADAGRRTPWQTFEITRINRRSDAIIEIWADHISMRLAKTMIKPKVEIHDADAETALRRWVSQLVGDDEWEVWSNIDTVGSTAWSVDSVENARQALGGTRGSILDVWGGEFEFDNKRVNLWQNLGRKTPVVLEYGRNITKIEKENKEETVYTSIYPFARAEEDKIITIPNYVVDGKYIDMYDHKKIKLVDFSGEFDTEENKPTAEKLQKLAEKYVEQNDVGAPHEHIKIEYVDLSKTLDYQNVRYIEEVELCDRIPIYYPKFDIYSKEAKVVVITYNVIKDENQSIELGVVGQGFGSTIASSLSGRMHELEQLQAQQSGQVQSLVNSAGNRIWYGEPPDDIEHKIGDVKFIQNGKYQQMYIWDGSQWKLIIDTEHLDRVEKLVEELEKYWEEAQAEFDKIQAENDKKLDEFESQIEAFQKRVDEFGGVSRQDILDALEEADISEKVKEAIKDAGFTKSLDDIEQRLNETAESARVTAEIVGGDGSTRYNKNRADTTQATIELEKQFVEIGSTGDDGWPVDDEGNLKELTISFEAECIPRGSSTVTVRLSTPLWYGAAIEMRPDNEFYPTADKQATAQTTELFAVYNDEYTLDVGSPWFAEPSTQRVTVDSDKTVTVNPRLKTIADGNLEAEFYGEWNDNPELIFDGGVD